MGKGYRKVKMIAGRKKATDDELLDCCKRGMFLHQIIMKFKVGLPRLRKIARTYEQSQDNKVTC